jgi:hypothetical protein
MFPFHQPNQPPQIPQGMGPGMQMGGQGGGMPPGPGLDPNLMQLIQRLSQAPQQPGTAQTAQAMGLPLQPPMFASMQTAGQQPQPGMGPNGLPMDQYGMGGMANFAPQFAAQAGQQGANSVWNFLGQKPTPKVSSAPAAAGSGQMTQEQSDWVKQQMDWERERDLINAHGD